MTGYGTLLGLTLRNRIAGIRRGSWRDEKGRLDWKHLGMLLLYAVCFLVAGGFIIFLEVMLAQGMRVIGHPELLPTLALLLCMVSMLFISFFHVLSSLYFSRDTVWLAYLPAKSQTVLAAKLTEVYLGEMLGGAVVLLPAFILYGVGQAVELLYWVRMALVVLTAPMLPLCIILLLTTLLTRVTSVTGHKDAWMMGGAMLFAVLAVVFEMNTVMKIPDDAGAAYFINLLVSREALLNQITGIFPPVRWAVHGLLGDGTQLLLFVGVSVLCLGAVWYVLGRRYLSLALRQTEHKVRHHKGAVKDAVWKQHSPLYALTRRELGEILRTPTYAFNCLPAAVVFPLLLVILLATSGSSAELGLLKTGLMTMMDTMQQTDLLLVMIGIAGFMCIINPAVSTAVSREGERHELSRMVPVSAEVQLRAKLIMGMLLNLLSMTVMSVVLMVVFPRLIGLILLGLIISQLLSLSVSALSLTVDAIRPNLHWTSETQVIKQSLNVMLGMVIGLVVLALPIITVVLTADATGSVRFALVLCVLLAEALVSGLMLKKVGCAAYMRLEDVA